MFPKTILNADTITLKIQYGEDIKATINIMSANENNADFQDKVNKDLEEYIKEQIQNEYHLIEEKKSQELQKSPFLCALKSQNQRILSDKMDSFLNSLYMSNVITNKFGHIVPTKVKPDSVSKNSKQFLDREQYCILDFYYQTAVEFLNKNYRFKVTNFIIEYSITYSNIPYKNITYNLNIDFEDASFVDFTFCNVEIISEVISERSIDFRTQETIKLLTVDLYICSQERVLNKLHICNCILNKFNNNLQNQPVDIILDQVYYQELGNINFDLNNLQAKNLVLQNYIIHYLENNESHGNKKAQNIMFVRNCLEQNSHKILFQNCVIETKIYKREKETRDYLFKSLFFQDCIFKYDFTLERLSFYNLKFIDCVFENPIIFHNCRIKYFNLQNCTVNNKLKMTGCDFLVIALMRFSIFKNEVSFQSSYFIGGLYLLSNHFYGSVDLIYTSYGSIINLSTSVYNSCLLINSINFLKVLGNKEEADVLIPLKNYNKFFKDVISSYFDKNKLYKRISFIEDNNDQFGKHMNGNSRADQLVDFRISCSIFKDTLDKLGNKIDANMFYALEHTLYQRELKNQPFINIMWPKFRMRLRFKKLPHLKLNRRFLQKLMQSINGGFKRKKIIISNSKAPGTKYIYNAGEMKSDPIINFKIGCDKFLFFFNNTISNHNSNLFRAILSFIGICCLGTVFTSWIDSVGFWKAMLHPKYWFSAKLSFNFDYLFKIIFPFEGIPNEHMYLKGGLVGKNKIAVNFSLAFFKVISIYIIWQIIKTANRNFKR